MSVDDDEVPEVNYKFDCNKPLHHHLRPQRPKLFHRPQMPSLVHDLYVVWHSQSLKVDLTSKLMC